jgi:O-antigen/teichoic acid export membrane protein
MTTSGERVPREACGPTRWWVLWRYSAPDPMAWIAMATFAVLMVASAVDGWGFGAALGGLALGGTSVWWAFVTNHFRMKENP